MNTENYMSHTVSEDWIIGVFGILVMAFFIGCTSCWPFFTDKSADSEMRRQPPPPPSPSLEARYEHGLYPPNPPPDAATQYSGHMTPSTGANHGISEKDFEEIQDMNAAQPSNVNEQNSSISQASAGESCADRGSYVNLVPVVKDPPIYLQIVSDTDVKTHDREKEENRTPRSAIHSIGKDSAHSDSLNHSYENVAVEAPPNRTPRSAIHSIGKDSSHSDSLSHSYENVAMEAPPIGPESDLDYENM